MIVSGGDEPSEIQQHLSADSLAGDGQPEPSVTGLFKKDALLLPQEVDRRPLVAIDPARECCEEDLPGLKGMLITPPDHER